MIISSDIWLIGTIGTGRGGGGQFVDIYATITDPLEVTIAMEELVEVTATVEAPEQITATVEVLELVDGELMDTDISSEIEEC